MSLVLQPIEYGFRSGIVLFVVVKTLRFWYAVLYLVLLLYILYIELNPLLGSKKM